MKSHKSIALLMIIVTGIVSFWLYPGINKANTAKYERVYEDTSGKKTSLSTLVGINADESDTSIHRIGLKKPAYLKQELIPLGGVKQLEIEMFSRATHFHESHDKVVYPSVELSLFIDSLLTEDKQPMPDTISATKVAFSGDTNEARK